MTTASETHVFSPSYHRRRRRRAWAKQYQRDRTVGSFHYHLRSASAPVTGGSIVISLRASVVSLPVHPGDVSPLVRCSHLCRTGLSAFQPLRQSFTVTGHFLWSGLDTLQSFH